MPETLTEYPIDILNDVPPINPFGDKVLCLPRAPEAVTAGGIVLPECAQEKPREALVLATGPGLRREDGTLIPMQVKVGQRVLFGKYNGTEIKLAGLQYMILREQDLLGSLPEKA